MDYLALFPISVGLPESSPLSLTLAVVLLYVAFIMFSYVLVSLLSPRLLSWRVVELWGRLLQQLMWWSCGFFFQFVHMVDYVNTFSYVEPFLYLWDEANLVMVDDIFDMFLDLVCQYFTEYFCINVHEWDWSVILLNSVFLWFLYQGNCSLINRAWHCSICFCCMEPFKEYCY